MDEENRTERRQYIRLEMNHLLKCEVFNLNEKERQQEESSSKNISVGGILFVSSTEHEIGDILKLEISIPGWSKYVSQFLKVDEITDNKPLVALAKVVRVEILPDSKYDIGVSLVGVDGGHKDALEKFIAANAGR